MNRKKFKFKKLVLVISIVFIAISLLWTIYVLDYYKADSVANELFSDENITIKDNMTFFYPADDKINLETTLLFYPGGKVEHKSYAPLLHKLSELGITSVLVDMPYNLAVFGINAADSLYEYFPQTQKFYIGGHSLGGAMASVYANKNSDKLDGLILLGAYPVGESNIKTIAIYGSLEDGWDKSKLTEDVLKQEILGGNHAQFGNYGSQKGDANATISREDQQYITALSVLDFIMSNK